jgi:thiamine-monophosphate kinase
VAQRLHRPEPRVELGERLRRLAHSAIDVSDGIAGDLGHIAERSQVSATVEYALIPKSKGFEKVKSAELERDCVLSGGDDYELVFTAPRAHRGELEALAAELKLALTRIGTIEAGSGLQILDANGKPISHRGGFDHFATAK